MSDHSATDGITVVSTKQEKLDFIEFPYQHYENDTYWVPPLKMEQKKLLNTDKNPFFQNAEIELFVAYRNDKIAGRIAAIIDHRYNDYHNTKTGFFGFFECIDRQQTANLMFRVAGDWLKARGMKEVLGPANPGMMDELGILVDGFDRYPSILMPYHKAYYDKLIKGAGLDKAQDLFTFEVNDQNVDYDRVDRAMEIVKRRVPGIHIRKMNLKKIKQEILIVEEIYNKAWKDNWGYIPLSKAEFDYLASDLKTIADDDFTHIAEVDGKPVGFSVALPDYNQVFKEMDGTLFPTGIFKLLFKRKKINRVRTALMGVLPEYRGRGIDILLHREAIKNGPPRGFKASEVGWILESNIEMNRVAERLGGIKDKTYRMYIKEL
ncbi:MAG: GNAT family N-acetyltransferase [Balneolaceae bacterium]